MLLLLLASGWRLPPLPRSANQLCHDSPGPAQLINVIGGTTTSLARALALAAAALVAMAAGGAGDVGVGLQLFVAAVKLMAETGTVTDLNQHTVYYRCCSGSAIIGQFAIFIRYYRHWHTFRWFWNSSSQAWLGMPGQQPFRAGGEPPYRRSAVQLLPHRGKSMLKLRKQYTAAKVQIVCYMRLEPLTISTPEVTAGIATLVGLAVRSAINGCAIIHLPAAAAFVVTE